MERNEPTEPRLRWEWQELKQEYRGFLAELPGTTLFLIAERGGQLYLSGALVPDHLDDAPSSHLDLAKAYAEKLLDAWTELCALKQTGADSGLMRVLLQMMAELRRAREKWPDWPEDPVHAAQIVSDQGEELVLAAMEHVCEHGDQEAMRQEAVRTLTTAARFLTESLQVRGGE